MIYIFLTIAVFGGLIGFIIWKFLNHIAELELLIKATNVGEVRRAKDRPKNAAIVPQDDESSLSEAFADKNPEEIRASFKK